MDLHKLSTDEVRGWEPARLQEVEGEIRLELAKLRMDIYTAQAQHSGQIRGLKKSLARVLTIANDKKRAAQPADQKAKASGEAK